MTIYYSTRAQANESRNKGDRIFYDADKRMYYVVAPTKRDF